MTRPFDGVNVLMLVENEPVPRDVRVWLEALALREAGAGVTVVCPLAEPGSAAYEILDGVEIHRYPARFAEGGAASYALEYGSAFWHMRRLSLRLARTRRFDVVHVANPPDLLLLAAKPLKRRGAKFVFDQHDAVPELYLTRFGRGRDAVYRTLIGLERMSYRYADLVIVTNESYRLLALERGRKRTGRPRGHPQRPRPCPVQPEARGPIPQAREAPSDRLCRRDRAAGRRRPRSSRPRAPARAPRRLARRLRRRRRRLRRCRLAGARAGARRAGRVPRLPRPGRGRRGARRGRRRPVAGAEERPQRDLDHDEGGRVHGDGNPVVAYDLVETRFSAGDAAAYAVSNEPASFAARIDELLDDSARRAEMGDLGLRRAREALSWDSCVERLWGPTLGCCVGREQEAPRRQVLPELEEPVKALDW